jgi:hypothetical protein
MATKTKIDPERLYRCVEPTSFADEDGVPVTIGKETVLLGKHAWVQRLPHLFAIEGDPEDQSRARAALIDPDEERAVHGMSRQSDVRILETRMKAKRAVKLDVDGQERRVRKGELLDPSELICSLVPSAFERVSAEHKR